MLVRNESWTVGRSSSLVILTAAVAPIIRASASLPTQTIRLKQMTDWAKVRVAWGSAVAGQCVVVLRNVSKCW